MDEAHRGYQQHETNSSLSEHISMGLTSAIDSGTRNAGPRYVL
jgi:hypothetical protein